MNILYCGDRNITDGIFLSALSLAKHSAEALKIYILTAGISEKNSPIPEAFAEGLENKLRETNPDNKTFLFDITELFCADLPEANLDTRFTPLCMLRLYADLLPEIPDKILYLDADVLCRKDFSELYSSDLHDAEIVGAADRYGKWFFGNILKHDYLNSGVLLMDMAKIRKNGTFAKCREMCRDKKMFMPDQSALNKSAVKKKIPVRFNEQGRIKKDTVFKHFSTYFEFFPYFRPVTVKPWDEKGLHEKLGITEFDDILAELNKEKNYE